MEDQTKAVIRAAVDDRFGDGMAEALEDYVRGTHTQIELATRFSLTQGAVSQRLRKAATYARRLAIKAGLEESVLMCN